MAKKEYVGVFVVLIIALFGAFWILVNDTDNLFNISVETAKVALILIAMIFMSAFYYLNHRRL